MRKATAFDYVKLLDCGYSFLKTPRAFDPSLLHKSRLARLLHSQAIVILPDGKAYPRFLSYNECANRCGKYLNPF